MQPPKNVNGANGAQTARCITNIAVLGAGFGSLGIIESCLLAGFSTTMIRITPGSTAEPRKRIIEAIMEKQRKGCIGKDAVEQAVGRLRASTDIAAAASSDLVLESTEAPWRFRQTTLRLAERATGGRAILASTAPTSTLRVIAARLSVRDRFLGIHFFSPAVLAGFCEVSVTNVTKPTVLEAAVQFVEDLGKTPVIVRDLPALLLLFSQSMAVTESRA